MKANKLTNDYVVRQDMEINLEAIKIKIDKELMGNIEKYGKIIQISIKDFFIKDNNQIYINTDLIEEDKEIWAKIQNEEFGEEIENEDLKIKTTNKIVELLLEKDIKGIYIDFNNINKENKENFKRFVIELTPKLREVGISTALKLNKNIEKVEYINIVDYII